MNRLRWFIRDILAFLFWLYLLTKLFVVDIDVILTQRFFPRFLYVLHYKLFILTSLVAITWGILGNKSFLKLFVFVSIYPWITVFWRIPKLLLRSKSWVIVLAYFSMMVDLLKSLKKNLIIFSIISILTIAILMSNQQYTLIPAMIGLGVYLVWHFVQQFAKLFKPAQIFGMSVETLDKISRMIRHQYLEAQLLSENNSPSKSETGEIKLSPHKLEQVLVVSRLWHFVAIKLRDLRKSKALVAFGLINLFTTLIITVVGFALLNFALYTMRPNSFVVPSDFKGFFAFVYYSINTIFTNNLADFYAVGGIARILGTLELLFGFFIIVILFFLVTTILKESHTEQLDDMIALARNQEDEITTLIRTRFNLSVDEAIGEIEKIKGSMLKLIYFLAAGK